MPLQLNPHHTRRRMIRNAAGIKMFSSRSRGKCCHIWHKAHILVKRFIFYVVMSTCQICNGCFCQFAMKTNSRTDNLCLSVYICKCQSVTYHTKSVIHMPSLECSFYEILLSYIKFPSISTMIVFLC